MLDSDGEYYYYAGKPDERSLKVLGDAQRKRKGVWINKGQFVTLESGRRVYTGDVIICASDDYSEVLSVPTDDVVPCETLLEGLWYFLTTVNAPGVYAVGSIALASSVLRARLSEYDSDEMLPCIIKTRTNGVASVESSRIVLRPRMEIARRSRTRGLTVAVIGDHAVMDDVRDIVRNKDFLFPMVASRVIGDASTLRAIELEPNLATSDRGVLRYVTRKAPPGGYAPNMNKPVTALAYTKSLVGDPVHIANAISSTMRGACEDELDGMPSSVSIHKDANCGSHWVFSYARIVMWHRRLKRLPAALRDPVALILPGAGHKDRVCVAEAVVNHVLYFAPIIRNKYETINKLVLLLAISMLWRILNVPVYAAWRKRHSEVLARYGLPQDAAAKVIAAEFCAYKPRIAGGAKLAVDRLHSDDSYAGLDMTKAKADAVAFLLKYAPKRAGLQEP